MSLQLNLQTRSMVSLVSLHNPNNHAHLAEGIRKKVTSMGRTNWKIKFSWVKAHAGVYGNEMADRLAKEAARSDGTNYGYSRIPKSAIYQEAAEEAIQKWQEQWTKSPKVEATKQYFPTVMDRIAIKIKLILFGIGKKNLNSRKGRSVSLFYKKCDSQGVVITKVFSLITTY